MGRSGSGNGNRGGVGDTATVTEAQMNKKEIHQILAALPFVLPRGVAGWRGGGGGGTGSGLSARASKKRREKERGRDTAMTVEGEEVGRGGGGEGGEYCWKQLAKQFNDEWWSIANFLESVGQGGVQAGWATMRPRTHWGICTWLVSQLSSAEARGGGLRQRFSIENQFITM